MVKTYFRYTEANTFGHSTTNICNSILLEEQNTLILASGETVVFVNATNGDEKEKFSFEKKSNVTHIKLVEDEFTKFLLVGFEDGDVILKHLELERELAEEKDAIFLEHQAAVRSLDTNSDGNLLASGGDDNLVVLWDILAKHPVYKFVGHTQPVTFVKFVTIGITDYILSGSKDGLLRLWDTSIRECVQVFRTNRNEVTCCLSFNQGKCLMLGTDSEELIFIEIGNFGKDQEKGIEIYLKERGRFTREYYGRVDVIAYNR